MGTEFAGKTVVVTGGTGALGGAVLARLLDEGAICHVPTSHDTRSEGIRLRLARAGQARA